jgi:hypothetical protein
MWIAEGNTRDTAVKPLILKGIVKNVYRNEIVVKKVFP